ncbi:MAG: hypothetical protein LR015_13215 [Verrucomicrobia bacterium]|nr:hypothetical protein [Verrucomicrobiota bacterium]
MTRIQKIFLGCLCVVVTLMLFRHLQPTPPIRGFDVDTFGRLPVQEGGRLKPMDAVARASLMAIGGKQTYRDLGRTASFSS